MRVCVCVGMWVCEYVGMRIARVGQRRPRRAADQEECPQEMREAGLCVKSSSVVVAVVVHRPMRRPQEDVAGIDRRESSSALVARSRPPDEARIG